MNCHIRMPLLFVGHGNPMNVLDDNKYSHMWETIGQQLSPPKAIICMSAHWLTDGSYITSSIHPEMIYDFYGFPQELYDVQYPAPGDDKLANKISHSHSFIKPDAMRGYDHGAWSVLKRMFPKAEAPVLQLSIDYSHSPLAQYSLLQQLKVLRNEGILFIGSGNIVHNLALVSMDQKPYDWAIEFEAFCKKSIQNKNINTLLDYKKIGTIAHLSIPTDDHFRPLLNTLALSYEDEEPIFFNEGIDMGSVSMLSVMHK
ncbi:MAG: 4,5-DOPA dioxygenase extradiol [Candidatus Roizmanbacteria bacterium]|nr:4,5-DOPA dioxygenase extradiol [Candidatus Roizmanbacteria bacterium]